MKTVLAFQLPFQKDIAAGFVCKALRISLKRVQSADWHTAVGHLAGFPGVPAAAAADDAAGVGEMLVFCGLTDAQLDEFLDRWKAFGAEPVALKAVLTPANQYWTPAKLYGQLQKERESLR